MKRFSISIFVFTVIVFTSVQPSTAQASTGNWFAKTCDSRISGLTSILSNTDKLYHNGELTEIDLIYAKYSLNMAKYECGRYSDRTAFCDETLPVATTYRDRVTTQVTLGQQMLKEAIDAENIYWSLVNLCQ